MSRGPLENLVACVNCLAVATKLFGDWPEYMADGSSIAKDDFADFLAKHRGHQLADLEVLDGPYTDRHFAEPVRVSYYNAMVRYPKVHSQRFILKRWRKKIEEPFRYKVISGSVKTRISKAEVSVVEMVRQIRRDLPNLSESKRNRFTREAIVILTDLGQCAAISGDFSCTEDPMVVRCRPSQIQLLYLKRAAQHYLGMEKEDAVQFVESQADVDGIFAINIIYDFELVLEKSVPRRRAKIAVHALHP